jgi:hypothetical protein
MDNKLKKYFANVPLLIYCLALVMDPRFRLSGLDDMFQIFNKNMSIERNHLYLQTKQLLIDMYHEYAPCYNSNAGTIEDPKDDDV